MNPFIWQNLAEISAPAVADRIESEFVIHGKRDIQALLGKRQIH